MTLKNSLDRQPRRHQHERRQRQQHDGAQEERGEPEREPEAGQHARLAQRLRQDAGRAHASHCGLGFGDAFRFAIDHEQRRARSRREQRAEALAPARRSARRRGSAADPRIRSSRRTSSLRDVAEAQLGAHFEAVHGLRFRTRIEQGAHALRRVRLPACPPASRRRYTASAETWRSRLADTASVAARAASSAQ